MAFDDRCRLLFLFWFCDLVYRVRQRRSSRKLNTRFNFNFAEAALTRAAFVFLSNPSPS